MSFPSGAPGGYPGQSPQQPTPGYGGQQPGQPYGQRPQPANPLGNFSLPQLLSLVTAALALVSYFCSYGAGAASLDVQVLLLLTGGLLVVLPLLPKAPNTLAVGAVLSTVGGLSALASVVQSSGSGIAVVILIFAVLQLLTAVGALLLDHELIKLAPRPAVPYVHATQHGFPPAGGFPPPQRQPQPGQPGGYGGSAAPSPTPQSTQVMQQPGQQQPGQQPANRAATQFMQQPGQLSPLPQPGQAEQTSSGRADTQGESRDD